MRAKLYKAISKHFKTKPYQSKRNRINSPVVYIACGNTTKTLNSLGMEGVWQIICFHPEGVLELDCMISTILKIVRGIPEIEGINSISEDDYDPDVQAYTRTITIKVPRGVY